MENLAADIAASTLDEFKDCLLSPKEISAYRVYTNPNNWELGPQGQMIFKPTQGLHFDMMPQKGWDIIYKPTNDVSGECGRCDSCGAPCDKEGCTKNRQHNIVNES